MALTTITDYKDDENFKALKAKAWAYINSKGDFSIDDMQPEEYKYFDKLLQIYGKLNDGKITKEQAAKEDSLNYREFSEHKDAYLDWLHTQYMRQESYKAMQAKLSKIDKSKNTNEIYDLMAECMEYFLVDESYSRRLIKKRHEVSENATN